MRAQTRNEISQGAIDLLLSSTADGAFAANSLRGSAGEQPSEVGRYRYGQYVNVWLRYWEDVHYQYRSGLYDEGEFAVQREATREFLNRAAGWVEYWCERRSFYSPEFAEMIDELLITSQC